MECQISDCSKPVDRQGLCFRHRISGVSFGFRGSARPGRKGWNTTANEYKLENFGTTSEKELADRGIVRADKY